MLRPISILIAACLAAPAPAQVLCHAENDGPNYEDGASVTNAWFAVKFVAPASFSVSRIEILTGEINAGSALDLWSHDPTNNQPNVALSTDAFTIQTAVGWQGVDLAMPAPLTATTTYWLVWHAVQNAQPSLDLSMPTFGQEFSVSLNNGGSWNGPFQSMDRHWKFRLYGDCCASTASYCTAGTSSSGCNALLSAAGVPDANAGSGFTVTASQVEGQKQGLLFYSVSGTNAQPWGTGSSFLCVKAPTQRTGAQNSGGTLLACDGSLALDFNAYIATHPTALGSPFAGGESVWIQAWYRDPPSPKTTSLSNGLAFSLCP